MKQNYNTRVKGAANEKLALKYLRKKHSYKILDTNYLTKLGEIDIIAFEKDILVFIEVKSKDSDAFGLPREEVTPQKQRKIINSAQLYMLEKKLSDRQCRFDVVEIFCGQITLLKDAFRVN